MPRKDLAIQPLGDGTQDPRTTASSVSNDELASHPLAYRSLAWHIAAVVLAMRVMHWTAKVQGKTSP